MQTLYTYTHTRTIGATRAIIILYKLSCRRGLFWSVCIMYSNSVKSARGGKTTTERRTKVKQKGWKRYGTKEYILGERNVQLFFTLNRQMGIHIEGKMETEKGSAVGAGIISASRKRQWWRLWRWYLEKTTNTWCVVYVCSRRWTFRCSFRLLFFFSIKMFVVWNVLEAFSFQAIINHSEMT